MYQRFDINQPIYMHLQPCMFQPYSLYSVVFEVSKLMFKECIKHRLKQHVQYCTNYPDSLKARIKTYIDLHDNPWLNSYMNMSGYRCF